MSSTGGFGIPGLGAGSPTYENQFIWGGDERQLGILRKSIIIVSTAASAGSTPTTVLPPGLIMGKITSTLKHIQWDASATNGSENIACVIVAESKSTDLSGTAVDRAPVGAILRAPLIAQRLLIKGVAFVGHADEYLARRMLHNMGCPLDDDPGGYLAGVNQRTVIKATSYTVLATDNGTFFTTRGAGGAVTFTLPTTIQRDMNFAFYNEAAQNLLVTAASGKLVTFNNLTATTAALQTSSELIGGGIRIRANDDASKWLMTPLTEETQTITVS